MQVKDPNTPLMSPGLLTGKIKAPPINTSSPTPNGYTNGHIPNGVNNNNIIKRGEEVAKSLLNSTDFKKLDTKFEDVVDISHMSSVKQKTTTTTNTEETLTETKTYQTKPISGSMGNGSIGSQKKSVIDEDRGRKVVKASIADKKVVTKMDPSKEFGSFSALSLPGLLLGKPATTAASTNNNNEYEKPESKMADIKPSYNAAESSSSYKNSFSSRSNQEDIVAKQKTSDDYSSNKLFTTTISKTIKDSSSSFGNSFLGNKTTSSAEQSFVISTDPEVKNLRPAVGPKAFEPVSTPLSSYSLKSKETETRVSTTDSSRARLSSPLSAINEKEKKTSLTGTKTFTHHTVASASKVNAVAPPRAMSRSPVRNSASPRRSKSPELPSWATKEYSSATSEVASKKTSYSASSSTTAVSSSGVKKSSSSISSRASPKRSLIPRRTSDASGKAGESSSPKGLRNSKGTILIWQ